MKVIELMTMATSISNEIFNDFIELYFRMNNSHNQIVLNFENKKDKTSREISISIKDTKKFIDIGIEKLDSGDNFFNEFVFSFLVDTKATCSIEWDKFIRQDKNFKLNIEEFNSFCEKLNSYLPIIFGKETKLKFISLKGKQLRLLSKPSTDIENYQFYDALFRIDESTVFFNKSDKLEDTKLIIEIVKLLKTSKSSSRYNWDSIIKYDIESTFDKDVVNQAKIMLKEHYNDIYEFYFKDFKEYLEALKEDKEDFLDFWKKEISTKLPVVKDLKKLSSYSRIKKEKDFPKVKLFTSTASVSFSNKTNIELLSLKINEEELNLVKNTEKRLKDIIAIFYPYRELKDHIDKHVQKLLLEFSQSKYSSYKYIYNCEDEILAKSNYYLDIYDRYITLNNSCLPLNDIEFSFNFTDNYFNQLNENIKSQFDIKINKSTEFFSKRENYYALKAILDNSKKGITTYISILKGETNSKIRDYGYDKSSAYGKLSQYTKKEIETIIRKLIRSNFILEKNLKASFGRYTGLELSKESIGHMKKNKHEENNENTTLEIEIFYVNDFIKNFVESDNNNRNLIFIKSLRDNIKYISKTDVIDIIAFIKDNRKLYRQCEKEIIDLFSYITPVKFKPLFLLNANLSNGVSKNTFTAIYNSIKGDSPTKEAIEDENLKSNDKNNNEELQNFEESNDKIDKDRFNNLYLCETCLFYERCNGVFCLK